MSNLPKTAHCHVSTQLITCGRIAVTVFATSLILATPVLAQSNPAAAPSSLPWYITRAAGLASLVSLIILAIMGIGITTGFIFRFMSPITAWTIHRLNGIFLALTVSIHILSLLFDHYITFSWRDILVPFASSYQPLYLSLGIIAFYLLVIVVVTSLIFIATKHKMWRLIHYLSYAIFFLVLIHSYFIGTDSHDPIIKLMYGGIVLLMIGLIWYRLVRFRRVNITANPTMNDYK